MIETIHTRACTGMKKGHNTVTVQNRKHIYINVFDHKELGNHVLQLCPKVVKRPVYMQGIPGNFPDFGKMFLKLKYTDMAQNTYIRS